MSDFQPYGPHGVIVPVGQPIYEAGQVLVDNFKALSDAIDGGGGGGSGLPMTGDAYRIVVQDTDDPIANGTAFAAAYAAAAALTPYGDALSATNRATVLLPPGIYEIDGFDFSADFVDVVGLDAGRGACLTKYSSATATDFRLANLTCGTDGGGFIWSSFSGRAENCTFGDWCIASDGGMAMRGTLVNCNFGNNAVNNAYIYGTIINCTAGTNSFTGDLSGDVGMGDTTPVFQGVTAGAGSFDLSSSADKALFKDCILTSGAFPDFASYPTVAVRDCVNDDGTSANYNPSSGGGGGTKILTITFMGLSIDEIPGTNISATVLYPNLYNNAGVEGDITVGGALPSAGWTGDIIFTPTNSDAIYDIEIFGRFAALSSHGDVQVGWTINTSGFMYCSAGYCRNDYPNAAQSGVVRHLGSAGATGPLQSAGGQHGVAQTLTIRIIQRP